MVGESLRRRLAIVLVATLVCSTPAVAQAQPGDGSGPPWGGGPFWSDDGERWGGGPPWAGDGSSGPAWGDAPDWPPWAGGDPADGPDDGVPDEESPRATETGTAAEPASEAPATATPGTPASTAPAPTERTTTAPPADDGQDGFDGFDGFDGGDAPSTEPVPTESGPASTRTATPAATDAPTATETTPAPTATTGEPTPVPTVPATPVSTTESSEARTTTAADGPDASISVAPDAIGPNGTAAATITLSRVPEDGFVGVDDLAVSVDPSVAAIENVSFHDGFTNTEVQTTGATAVFSAADFENEFSAGETNVTIATLTIAPVGNGTTAVEITGGEFQNLRGNALGVSVSPGTLAVDGVPATPAPAPTATDAPTERPTVATEPSASQTETEQAVGTATASPDPVDLDVTVAPGSISANETATANVTLSSVPETGLIGTSGLAVSVDPAVASIEDVSFGDGFSATEVEVANGTASINAADFRDRYRAGETNVTIATLTLSPAGNGTTVVNVTGGELQNVSGYAIPMSVSPATLTVEGASGGTPAPTATETPETTTVNGPDAAYDPSISVNVEPDDALTGETVTATLVLSSAPPEQWAGLSNVTVAADPSVAEIDSLSVNETFDSVHTTTASDSLTFRTIDFDGSVRPGQTDVVIGTLTLEATGTGATAVGLRSGSVVTVDGVAHEPAFGSDDLNVSAA